MLIRTDPCRELDRLTQQAPGTDARPAVAAMDAYRKGDTLDPDHIGARYCAGVLTLTIPTRKQARPCRIQVTSNDDRRQVTAS